MITAARRDPQNLAVNGCAPSSVYHVLAGDAPACGIVAAMDLATRVDASLVATLLRCGRLGCREAWPGAQMAPLVAYTDGSGTVATLPCGAGVVVYDGDPAAALWNPEGPQPVVEASYHLGLGTNNHAELCAIGIALALTNEPPLRGRYLILRSDSAYALHMVRGRGPLDPERLNARVINRIRYALHGRQIRFEHVQGHSKIPGNDRADHLASIGRKRGIAKETAA